MGDLYDSLECLRPRNIVDKKCAVGIFVVYSSDSAEAILTGDVPELKTDSSIIAF